MFFSMDTQLLVLLVESRYSRGYNPGGGGGVLPYMALTGTCSQIGYGFQPFLS